MAIGPGEKADAAIKYAHQAEKLSLSQQDESNTDVSSTTAVEAKFITPLDNVVETASGERLPGVPPVEALKFNELKHRMEGKEPEEASIESPHIANSEEQERAQRGGDPLDQWNSSKRSRGSKDLGTDLPPSRTHPLFPPLPLYGPPTAMRNLQCYGFQVTSFFLSLGFLMVIVLGSAFTAVPLMFRYVWARIRLKNPQEDRPLYHEEMQMREARRKAEQEWSEKVKQRRTERSESNGHLRKGDRVAEDSDEYEPMEGGKDPIICDAAYYARRVGLDMEEFKVQTEDGFIIRLWHIYNPKEYNPTDEEARSPHRPVVFPEGHVESGRREGASARQFTDGNRRYPVLMMHGLLQSAGAYCVNDDHSLAFYLAKSGYDVWLGNNRCGFHPEHAMLKYNDPRMWAWNIRQMGVMDLPALVSRVLSETGFEKLGLICHSQGTTQTFVSLAKEQRPELGEKISVFCALAPPVYAGPLIGKMYFKFMRVISPAMFRVFFGIHAFIPFMMLMHRTLPGRLYGFLGYRVFSFLFNWTDTRWDRDIRDRAFQFSPVYVSAESMRWWLGRECFAAQKCILATKDQQKADERASLEAAKDEGTMDADFSPESSESDLDEQVRESTGFDADGDANGTADETNKDESTKPAKPRQNGRQTPSGAKTNGITTTTTAKPDPPRPQNHSTHQSHLRGQHAWYSSQCPPIALWIAGSDDLVDGSKLLRRFQRGREPHVKLVHSKIIPEYEHLDVIWAIDMIEQVGKEVKEVIWRSIPEKERRRCRMIKGCEESRDFFG